MPSTACVVINCDSTYTDKVTRRHHFPKDPLRFRIWVQRSGNNKLLNKTVDDVYKSFVMCDKHFEPCYKSFGLQKLSIVVVPTLNLPDMIEIANVDCESDSTNKVCLMDVSTVPSTMNISIDKVNVDGENSSTSEVCLMNVSTVSSVMNISLDRGLNENESTPLLPRTLFSMRKNKYILSH